jgi:hypothetical protein
MLNEGYLSQGCTGSHWSFSGFYADLNAIEELRSKDLTDMALNAVSWSGIWMQFVRPMLISLAPVSLKVTRRHKNNIINWL